MREGLNKKEKKKEKEKEKEKEKKKKKKKKIPQSKDTLARGSATHSLSGRHNVINTILVSISTVTQVVVTAPGGIHGLYNKKKKEKREKKNKSKLQIQKRKKKKKKKKKKFSKPPQATQVE